MRAQTESGWQRRAAAGASRIPAHAARARGSAWGERSGVQGAARASKPGGAPRRPRRRWQPSTAGTRPPPCSTCEQPGSAGRVEELQSACSAGRRLISRRPAAEAWPEKAQQAHRENSWRAIACSSGTSSVVLYSSAGSHGAGCQATVGRRRPQAGRHPAAMSTQLHAARQR